MYKLKQINEDFIVYEIFDKNMLSMKQDTEHKYSIFLLKKQNMTTEDAVQKIAECLKIKRSYLGIAGIKDKNAITEQYISVYNLDRAKVERMKIKNINLEFQGYSSKPISIGDLEGNKFQIIIRNLDANDKIKFLQSLKILKYNDFFIPNYFDEQRFSRNNVEIGKLLLKKDFKSVAGLFAQNEKKMNIEVKDNDYLKVIKKIPMKVLTLFIHSFQSYIFNETLKNYLTGQNGKTETSRKTEINRKTETSRKTEINRIMGIRNSVEKNDKTGKEEKTGKKINYSEGEFFFPGKIGKNFTISVIGFGSELSGEEKKIIDKILQHEEIKLSDFVIRQLPELSVYGATRDAFFRVENFKYSQLEDDDLNKSKQKISLEFELPKGSYATIVVKFLFS